MRSGHIEVDSLYGGGGGPMVVNSMNAPNNSTLQCGCENIDCPFCNQMMSIQGGRRSSAPVRYKTSRYKKIKWANNFRHDFYNVRGWTLIRFVTRRLNSLRSQLNPGVAENMLMSPAQTAHRTYRTYTRNTADEGSTILKKAIKMAATAAPRPSELFPSTENKKPNLSRDYFSPMVPNSSKQSLSERTLPSPDRQTPLIASSPLLPDWEIR